MAAEETIIHILDLPEGTDYVWYPDANMVGLARRLDCEGRVQALADLSATWRRSVMHAVA
jgi:hypothetical protein